jgi:hypothetical protein
MMILFHDLIATRGRGHDARLPVAAALKQTTRDGYPQK